MAVVNALGTLIGYLGAEVAIPDIFDRLLWPERFYNNATWRKALQFALFMPMGGPLHKAALSTLDRILKNGLFKGDHQGHMLGSPFYPDTKLKYVARICAKQTSPEIEYVRNGLWVRVLSNLPICYRPPEEKQSSEEEGLPLTNKRAGCRAIHRVSHLKISLAGRAPNQNQVFGHETGVTSFRTYLALVVTELTGIVTGVIVYCVLKSWFLWLWLAPVLLKLLSAAAAVERTDYAPGSTVKSTKVEIGNPVISTTALTATCLKFEVLDSKDGFLVIEGDESLVLPFFRHYGHPIRDRFRESIQFGCIIAFGFIFPIGLLSSILWMSEELQYIWLGYQMYATVAMHVYRYGGGRVWGTTEERIAERLDIQAKTGCQQHILFAGKDGIISVKLAVAYFDRYMEGNAYKDRLMTADCQEKTNEKPAAKSAVVTERVIVMTSIDETGPSPGPPQKKNAATGQELRVADHR